MSADLGRPDPTPPRGLPSTVSAARCGGPSRRWDAARLGLMATPPCALQERVVEGETDVHEHPMTLPPTTNS
jgi:hypothetical protein